MEFIDKIKLRAKLDKKTIILPESMDERILKASRILVDEEICNVILIGDIEKIKLTINTDNITIINPKTYYDSNNFVKQLYELRKDKGLTIDDANNLIFNNNMYFACMLIKNNIGDGIVSGAFHSTSDTLRPALQIIKTKINTSLVSSFFVMDVPNCKYGENGIFLFSDAGLEQNPNSEKLACIAGDTANSFKLLLEKEPKVAMLSHSTKGSAKHSDVDKVMLATKIAKDKFPQFLIDGELQLDAAIVPEIAKFKAPNSEVAGYANVLIFPDLDAGNIGYKLVQRLANAKAYGPICQGIKCPVNDLSRGCTINDIVGVVAITCIQAQ